MPARIPARKRPDPSVSLHFSNGETLSGPLPIWVMAILDTLPAQQQQAVYNKVRSMTQEQPTKLYTPKGALNVI